MIGEKVIIKQSDEMVKELWGVTGVIEDIVEEDMSSTREFYDRDEKTCPDEKHYWIKFDQPINAPKSNVHGWKRCWLYLKYFSVVN